MTATFLPTMAVNMDANRDQENGPEIVDIFLEGVPVTVEVLTVSQFNALPELGRSEYGISRSGNLYFRVIPADDRQT